MRYPLIVTCLLAFGCGESDDKNANPMNEQPVDEGPTLVAPPPGEGFQMAMDVMVPPFTEMWVCDVGPMPNEAFAPVSRVQVQQTPGTHHLTLSTLGLTPGSPLEHGRYDCTELYGDSSLMQDQIMFYGNQGDATHEMQLPEGVAANIPPNLTVIHEMHYVNVTDKPVRLYSRLNAWTMPADEVTTGIWGGQVRDENIEIPPNSTHTEWSRCVMNEDVEILFVAAHTHKLGTKFTVAPFDGQTVGDIFYTNTDWHTPQIVQYDPPMIVSAGQGFEWACTWNNPSDKAIHYGLTADDEMCNLAIVHTPFSLTARCEVVETSDGVLWSVP